MMGCRAFFFYRLLRLIVCETYFQIEVQERRSLFAKTNIELKVLRINGKVLYLQNQKLVPMKKEIGKWLMDIAKYITTAVLLSAVFRDMESPWVVIGGISAAMGTLAWGLYLIRDNETSHKPHKKRK